MSASTAILAVLVMAAVTFATRIGGILVMARIPLSPRVEAFLRYLSGSVLVAVVVPPVVGAGPAAWLATAVTLIVMLRTRHALLALLAGMLAAALYRAALA